MLNGPKIKSNFDNDNVFLIEPNYSATIDKNDPPKLIGNSYEEKDVFFLRVITFLSDLICSICFLIPFATSKQPFYFILSIATVFYSIFGLISSLLKEEGMLLPLNFLGLQISISAIFLYIYYFIPANIAKYFTNTNIETAIELTIKYEIELLTTYLFGIGILISIIVIGFGYFLMLKSTRYIINVLSIIHLAFVLVAMGFYSGSIYLRLGFVLFNGIGLLKILFLEHKSMPKLEGCRVFCSFIITYSMFFAYLPTFSTTYSTFCKTFKC